MGMKSKKKYQRIQRKMIFWIYSLADAHKERIKRKAKHHKIKKLNQTLRNRKISLKYRAPELNLKQWIIYLQREEKFQLIRK